MPIDVPPHWFCRRRLRLQSSPYRRGPTKNYNNKTRGMPIGAPHMWNALMTKLADMSIA